MPAAMDRAELERRIRAVPIWYHTMELAPGVVTPGEFDMRPYVDDYGLPASLRGLTVADLGASNGFFSFELERRGADRVFAIELKSVVDHDVPRWYHRRELARRGAAWVKQLDHDQLHAGFELAHEALGSRVEMLRHHTYELEAKLPGAFDLVFCSNVLHHLRDPVDALENMRAALKPGGTLVLGCSCDLRSDASYAIFEGDLEWIMWWVMSKEAILRMCRFAGFEDVEWKGSFSFTPTRFKERVGHMGIIHARAPRNAEGPTP
ncbi:MAG: methyltransferase [Planctomycetes bacterium]|nr:methyltransferase [Planctomycetota bacterium]